MVAADYNPTKKTAGSPYWNKATGGLRRPIRIIPPPSQRNGAGPGPAGPLVLVAGAGLMPPRMSVAPKRGMQQVGYPGQKIVDRPVPYPVQQIAEQRVLCAVLRAVPHPVQEIVDRPASKGRRAGLAKK